MRGKSTIFLLILLLIFKISTAQWQMTSGPALLAPNCIAKVDSILFVGTNNGIYKSVDEGVTWTPINNGVTINSLKVLFVNNSIIYVGTNVDLFFPVAMTEYLIQPI